MATFNDAVAAVMAAELERRVAWDEMPGLYRIKARGGRPRLIDSHVPAAIWEADRPPAVLAMLAEAMCRLNVIDPDVHGMAFRFESWRVEIPDPKANAFQARRVAEMSREHTLHGHPQRVEARSFYACLRDGTVITADLDRGKATARTNVLPYQEGADMQPAGSVIDALDHMVAQLSGGTAPKRPDDTVPDRRPGRRPRG